MQSHQLSPNHRHPDKKRVGRGGKRGTYSGRGGKGQTARAGRKMRPIIRDVLKRYPKLRGYKNKPSSLKPQVIDIAKIEKFFDADQIINPQILVDCKLVRRVNGKIPPIKVLGSKTPSKPLKIEGCIFSQSAKNAIEKSGGAINVKLKTQS